MEEPSHDPKPISRRKAITRLGLITADILAADALGVLRLRNKAQQTSETGQSNSGSKLTTPEHGAQESEVKRIAKETVEKYGYKNLLYPVSKSQGLPETFPQTQAEIPLVSVSPKTIEPKDGGEPKVAELIQKPLAEMFAAAEANGQKPIVRSGFRDVETQRNLYNYRIEALLRQGLNKEEAEDKAGDTNAAPLHSEHHLGTTVDIMDTRFPGALPGQDIGWDIARKIYTQGMWGWMRENAHTYGFVISYPTQDFQHLDDSKPGSGVRSSEPWHIRFVGIELATYMHDTLDYLNPANDITLNSVLNVIAS